MIYRPVQTPATLGCGSFSGRAVSPGQRGPSETAAAVKHQLHDRLLRLSFPAFECVIREVLSKSGYSSVRLAGRLHKRGRTRHGGLDMTAYTYTDLSSALSIVQAKQYRRPVSRRFVDELRGTMLRVGARQGLLITTSGFSSVAQAAADHGAAPIKLMDGDELLDLLVAHGIGVRGIRGRGARRCTLDEAFFKRLEAAYPLRRKAASTPRGSSAPAAEAGSATQAHNSIRNSAEETGASGGDMTWNTHVLIGMNAVWLFELLPKDAVALNIGILTAVAALGALVPDLDAAESKLKHLSVGGVKPFLVPAVLLHRQFGHRGLAHSLVGLSIFALLSVPLAAWWGWAASIALVLGYASHLAADACTRWGIPFLYPRKRRYHLLPAGWRFVTGSEAEAVLFPFLALAVLLLLVRHLPYQ